MIIHHVKAVVWKLLLPILTLLVLLSYRLFRGYARLKIGECRFYGPQGFLDLCKRALEMLDGCDRAVYQAVVSGRFVCWYEPRGSLAYFRHLCPVSEAYFAWREQGVITCLVYSYFKTKMYHEHRASLYDNAKFLQEHRLVYRHVGCWLESHGFPHELIQLFLKPCK